MNFAEYSIILLLIINPLRPVLGQQQCSVNRLPMFGDTNHRDVPNRDKFQAIVPAYTFQCPGRVTEWRACVKPGGGSKERYYIQFQVWRPNSPTGCYSLVGYNIPLDDAGVPEREISNSTNIIEAEGYLDPPDNGLNHCVVLPVRESKQIEVQPDDVVGYYVDHFRHSDNDRNDGGIQWIETENDDIVVHYKDNIPRYEINHFYALGGPNPTECSMEISGNSVTYTLSKKATNAPIISLSVASIISISTSTLQPLRVTSSIMSLLKIATSSFIRTSSITRITESHSAYSNPEKSTNFPSSTNLPVANVITLSLQSSPLSLSSSSPPSISESGGSRSIGLGIVVGIVVASLTFSLVLAIILLVSLLMIKKRRNWIFVAASFNNPSYVTSSGISSKLRALDKRNPNRHHSSHYEYCKTQVSGETDRIHAQPVYATLENPSQQSLYEVANDNGAVYHYLEDAAKGIGQDTYHDYTAVYEDPTSPSYTSEVYSSGSVFDTAGTCVPTLEARRGNYKDQQSSYYNDNGKQKCNITHQFFAQDPMYWAPASTTLGLYEQLCTKCYREINRNQIHIHEKIGSGQFGTVSKGVWRYKTETMQVAVKILTNTASEVERVKFLQEAAIMGQFYHPNIVRLHGVVTVGDPVLIVLDFMPNGDMKSYLDHLVIRSNDQTIFPRKFLKYCREIAAGMAYLAKKSFVHRDLAARNILLDDRMSCKVGDFGMARDLMDDTYYKSKGGKIPVKWTAPEALLYKKFSTASDVWSYAMVLYEIWSVGNKPFQNLNNNETIARLQNRKCLAPPSGCPRQVYSLMVDCWNPEPHLRPTFDTAFRVLRRPEELLLHWSEEDVSAGRHLLKAKNTTHSFADLQNKYIR